MTSQPNSLLTSEEIDLTPEQAIQLLEERLVVRSDKRKVRMIEVPIRREKLIVEQVQPRYERLAEIDLGKATEIELSGVIVSGEFDSPRTVSDLLDAIARTPNHNCAEIRVEIKLKDSKHQDTYQSWFDRCRKS
jgi:hypothetical protein